MLKITKVDGETYYDQRHVCPKDNGDRDFIKFNYTKYIDEETNKYVESVSILCNTHKCNKKDHPSVSKEMEPILACNWPEHIHKKNWNDLEAEIYCITGTKDAMSKCKAINGVKQFGMHYSMPILRACEAIKYPNAVTHFACVGSIGAVYK